MQLEDPEYWKPVESDSGEREIIEKKLLRKFNWESVV